jgi:antitoxin YefM
MGEVMNKIIATRARNEFFDIIKKASEQHQIYRIEHRKGNVVLMSEDEYDSLMETLELLSIPGFAESIKRSVEQMKNGETLSVDEVFGAAE